MDKTAKITREKRSGSRECCMTPRSTKPQMCGRCSLMFVEILVNVDYHYLICLFSCEMKCNVKENSREVDNIILN